MRNYQEALNLTVNWIGEREQARPSNKFFIQLVTDCVLQLRAGYTAYCFTEEQRVSIKAQFVSRKYALTFEDTDGIVEIRRVIEHGHKEN